MPQKDEERRETYARIASKWEGRYEMPNGLKRQNDGRVW